MVAAMQSAPFVQMTGRNNSSRIRSNSVVIPPPSKMLVLGCLRRRKAKMLLSDWVFAQSPKAISELVTSLTSQASFQKLMPSTNLRQNILGLPEKSGGTEILEYGLSCLESKSIQDDRRRMFARIASAQAPDEIVDEKWLNSPMRQSDLLTWLRNGLNLGSLPRVKREKVQLDLQKAALTRQAVSTLIRAARFDLVLTSQHNVQLLQSVFLSGEIEFDWWHPIAEPPLYLVAMVLGGNRYFHPRHLPDTIVSALDDFGSGKEDNWSRECREKFPFVAQCYELTPMIGRYFLNQSNRSDGSTHHDELIEEFRKVWGSRTAIVLAAIEGAINRRVNPTSTDFDFFDGNLTLPQRVRAAKARRKNADWWGSQFSTRSTIRSHRALLVIAFFVFAPASIVDELEKIVGTMIDGMPEDDWIIVRTVVGRVFERPYGGGSQASAEKTPSSVPSSIRTAYLKAIKEPASVGREVFMQHFLDTRERDVAFLQFRQRWSLECAMQGVLDWELALQIITQTYRDGIDDLDPYIRYRNIKLPEHVSSKVLANSPDFPLALWSTAEENAATLARKAVRPVGSVARSERWFVT
jgi:hypothetical protein